MSDGMGREFTYLSSHATNRYFIPNWGIYYMNEYEEKEKLLDSIRDNLMEKGLDWSEDETYNEVYNRKLKYED